MRRWILRRLDFRQRIFLRSAKPESLDANSGPSFGVLVYCCDLPRNQDGIQEFFGAAGGGGITRPALRAPDTFVPKLSGRTFVGV